MKILLIFLVFFLISCSENVLDKKYTYSEEQNLFLETLGWAGFAFKAGNEPDGISRVLDGGYTGDWKPGDRLPIKLNSPPSRGGQGIY